MNVISRLQQLGFSEYEAKTYLALLQQNPATGYQVSQESGVPRFMIYEVLNKLVARGAARRSPAKRTALYSPVPADELLDRLRHEFEEQLDSTRRDLEAITLPQTAGYVWNIEGEENILARAREMIDTAESQVHIGLLPEMLPKLRTSLEKAVTRHVEVLINT